MSVLENDRIAEDLFARLEELEGYMNLPEYTDRQQGLLRLLSTGQFEEAQDEIMNLEAKYSYERHQAVYEGLEEANDGF